MKLVEDYRMRFELSMIWFFIPLIIYYFVFKQLIYDLVAGGFIFVYFTLMMIFINRYYKVFAGYFIAKKMHFESKLYYKQLNPLALHKNEMTVSQMRCIEILEILTVVLTTTFLLLLSYFLKPDGYVNHLLLGTWILNFTIFRKNVKYIIKSFQYPNAKISYTDKSIRIYQ